MFFGLVLLVHLLLIAALIYIWIDIIRLFIDPHFRECPPLVPSFGKLKKGMIEKISLEIEKKNRKISFLDPGCGTGTLLISLAKKYPDCRFVGIEWRKATAQIARFRTRNLKNVKIIWQDMFDFSFADFEIIGCFLMQPLMERFGEKLKKECHKGTIVFSNSFYIPQIKPSEVIKIKGLYKFNDIFVYKF